MSNQEKLVTGVAPPRPPPMLVIQTQNMLHNGKIVDGNDHSIENQLTKIESDEERRVREERENAEKNELSLIRMLVRHNQNIGVTNNFNVNLNKNQTLANTENNNNNGVDDNNNNVQMIDEDFFTRDEFARTTSLVESRPGEVQAMSQQYKMVTSGVLWFCYFSLALNDYIFGPTFDDLSKILQCSFEQISYFAVYRQFAYTLGSLGGLSFNYINRQMGLVTLLLLSGASLFLTPYSPSIGMFYLIAVLNGFAAGACDVGFHVWILEMFQDGGGPLLQALHFSFGIGIAVAPLITANFLSGESECGKPSSNLTLESSHHHELTDEMILEKRATIFIPYAIIGAIVTIGGTMLGSLYFYKRYIPPKERKLPVSFDEQMPKQLSRMEKLELWKKSVPSFYIILIISLGSSMLFAYYGLEVTYFQFLAQFTTAVPLPIAGSMAANLEAATGAAYSIGGFIAIMASMRIHPQNMIYLNFVLMNIGIIMLNLFYQSNLTVFWLGNIFVGFGFSSCYATAYTFLEHQINVTNLIGSVFLFAGGLGTAIFPMLLSKICSNPEFLIYLSYFAINFSLLLFILMHTMTNIRGRQVKLIKNQLLKAPATLTQFKERTLSTLSYEPQ